MNDPGMKSGSERLDPRRYAYREDLAAAYLEGKIHAPRFAKGEPAQIARGTMPVRHRPEVSLGLETEALFGETATIFDESGGWAWVQLDRDGYVGYVPADAMQRKIVNATHRVQALGTFVYPAADLKTPPVMHLPMNAVVGVARGDEHFSELQNGGFVISRHLHKPDKTARDFVEIAERFVGTPYLWGGRTRIGIDCSGLVQTALQASGLAAPRDTDMQQAETGENISIRSDLQGLRRGDLIFWRGHVGIMLDAVMFLHANAYHMAVTVETLPEAAARIAKVGGPITAIKRLAALGA